MNDKNDRIQAFLVLRPGALSEDAPGETAAETGLERLIFRKKTTDFIGRAPTLRLHS